MALDTDMKALLDQMVAANYSIAMLFLHCATTAKSWD
jgi:hypothetical protein